MVRVGAAPPTAPTPTSTWWLGCNHSVASSPAEDCRPARCSSSDGAHNVTGVLLPIDGGYVAVDGRTSHRSNSSGIQCRTSRARSQSSPAEAAASGAPWSNASPTRHVGGARRCRARTGGATTGELRQRSRRHRRGHRRDVLGVGRGAGDAIEAYGACTSCATRASGQARRVSSGSIT